MHNQNSLEPIMNYFALHNHIDCGELKFYQLTVFAPKYIITGI
jgi:hypothetical protein